MKYNSSQSQTFMILCITKLENIFPKRNNTQHANIEKSPNTQFVFQTYNIFPILFKSFCFNFQWLKCFVKLPHHWQKWFPPCDLVKSACEEKNQQVLPYNVHPSCKYFCICLPLWDVIIHARVASTHSS